MSSSIGIYASQISGHLVTNNYSSIQTVTVGSGGASSITFSSIPSTYTHLQIRGLGHSANTGSVINGLTVQANGDTSANYSWHYMLNYSGSLSSGATANASSMGLGYINLDYNIYKNSSIIIDVIDYANVNKYKTFKSLVGYDFNNENSYKGAMAVCSSNWRSTSAITSLTLTTVSGFTQYSTFALYGIK